MKKLNILTLLLAILTLLSCEDEVIINNNSIGYITGSSDRAYFTASFGDKMGYIDKNGDQVFDTTFAYAEDFYNGLAVYGEALESTDRTTYTSPQTYSTNYTYSTSESVNGEYMTYYGIYGKDLYGDILPSNCKYYDYYNDTELTGYAIGDKITTRYRIKWTYYGDLYENDMYSYNIRYSYHTLDGKSIDESSSEIYFYNDTYYVTVPYYKTIIYEELKYGYIDTKGEIVIPATYKYAANFTKDGFAIVSNKSYSYYNQESYFINKNGQQLSDGIYYYANFFNEGLAAVQYTEDGKYQFINTSGSLVITTGYDEAFAFLNGIAAVKNNGFYGFIDKNGEEILPLRYKNTTGIYTNGFIGVSDNYDGYSNDENKWFFITIEGKNEFGDDMQFDNLEPFFEGLAAVEIDKQWFFINTSGEYAFEKSFDEVSGYSESLAAVHDVNDLWGYINKTGEYTILSQFRDADDFINGVAKVVFIDYTWGYIDTAGDEIWRSTETINNNYDARTQKAIDRTNEYIKKAIRLN